VKIGLSRTSRIIVFLLVGAGIIGSLSFIRIGPFQASNWFFRSVFLSPLPTPLPTPADTTAIQAALTYQEQFLPNRSGSSPVVFTRRIRFKDFSALGLGTFAPATGSDPQLEIVLLKGDFDTSNYGITQKVPFTQAAYLVIVYDLDQKAIANVTVSVYGDEIRPLLEMAGEKPITPDSAPPKK